ncbi:MAG: ParB/RepB/Spo0J family partition protein [Oscillospiraceae bacterium]|nr:ParB/RepB/Spo0J family partition protein [Oscillospiraceae bacterium]
MAAKKGGLGKGLDTLFMDNSVEEISSTSAVKLKIMDIEPNREQPRKDFDDAALGELADSIAKYGVLQPLLVRPLNGGGYQLIAGERRWRASRLAGLTEVPVVVREMTDEEAAALALIENLQREDLNPLEEAFGFRKLMDDFGLTQEEAAEKVGKSRPAVANALRLLKLPEAILDLVRSGELSAGHARALLSFPTQEQMLETAQLIMDKGLSVRETERLAKKAAKPKKEKETPARRASYYDQVELALTEALCRKIRIQNGKNETGTIEIAFNSKEDLERIANALHGLEE